MTEVEDGEGIRTSGGGVAGALYSIECLVRGERWESVREGVGGLKVAEEAAGGADTLEVWYQRELAAEGGGYQGRGGDLFVVEGDGLVGGLAGGLAGEGFHKRPEFGGVLLEAEGLDLVYPGLAEVGGDGSGNLVV